jgi:hypothetical protein
MSELSVEMKERASSSGGGHATYGERESCCDPPRLGGPCVRRAVALLAPASLSQRARPNCRKSVIWGRRQAAPRQVDLAHHNTPLRSL